MKIGSFLNAAQSLLFPKPSRKRRPRGRRPSQRRPSLHRPSRVGEQFSRAAGRDEAPVWFDGPSFIEAMKLSLVRLHAAWDHDDLTELAGQTSPQVLFELRRARREVEHAPSHDVAQLQAELEAIARQDALAVASVRFSGVIHEEERGSTQALHQVWHLEHDWDDREGDWRILGIQELAIRGVDQSRGSLDPV